MAGGALNVGNAAGSMVIVLETDETVLLQTSVAAHVSTIVPPQVPGVAVLVDVADPLIRQAPLPLLE